MFSWLVTKDLEILVNNDIICKSISSLVDRAFDKATIQVHGCSILLRNFTGMLLILFNGYGASQATFILLVLID